MSSRQFFIQDNNQPQGPNLKTKILIILLGILSLLIFYYIEKLAFNIVNFLCYFLFLSIFIFILLHLLIIRFIVMIFIFPGKNYFIKKIMQHQTGKILAEQFLRILKLFQGNCEYLKTSSNENLDIMKLSSIKTSK